MLRQMKNRRSDSSCSNYSQHSNSLAVLEPVDNENNSKKLEYATIEKIFIIEVYDELRQHQNERKKVQIQSMMKWRSATKKFIQDLRTYMRHNQTNIKGYKYNENKKNQQISNLKMEFQQQRRTLQNEKNKCVNQLNSEFYRKQLEYKQIVKKFVDTLNKSQKYWTKIQTQLSSKLRKAEDLIKQKFAIQAKNYQVYEQISNFTDDLYNQHDDSLRSISLSHDEIIVQMNRQESRRNTIDISSIQEIDQIDEPIGQNENQDDFQQSLIRMICWGFFVEKNQGNIRKIIQITKNLQNPETIIKQPIFPILLQSIKLNLDLDRQPSLLGSHSDIECENRDRIVMRDIQNQQQL